MFGKFPPVLHIHNQDARWGNGNGKVICERRQKTWEDFVSEVQIPPKGAVVWSRKDAP